jgi:hypothetical protein
VRDPQPGDIVVATGDPTSTDAEYWLQAATFTLVETSSPDRRTIVVDSVPDALKKLAQRTARWPLASAVCDDVLRVVDPAAPVLGGVVAESLAYSALQAGPEFARWLREREPTRVPVTADPVTAERRGDVLSIRFNRPARHNAFSTDARAALLEALTVAVLDDGIGEVVLSGAGPSFCSGGDLAEFGSFTDPVAAHLARTRHSPALLLAALTDRLGARCRAEVHGQVLGSGLEMAAFCGRVACHRDAVLGLPEVALGLIPGAGGTVSVTRRIGRWRTAYLVLSGEFLTPATALAWGLVDELR